MFEGHLMNFVSSVQRKMPFLFKPVSLCCFWQIGTCPVNVSFLQIGISSCRSTHLETLDLLWLLRRKSFHFISWFGKEQLYSLFQHTSFILISAVHNPVAAEMTLLRLQWWHQSSYLQFFNHVIEFRTITWRCKVYSVAVKTYIQ